MTKIFKFQGEAGHFVPGLPFEITDEEAKDHGLGSLLKECVEAGLYKEVKPKAGAGAEASHKESR